MQSREAQTTMMKWTNSGGQTKRANERSFVYLPPAWRRWRDVKTTYREIREVNHHVYVKRQTQICTSWPSFPHYLSFISTHKSVVSPQFLSIRTVSSCFYLLIFYFEKFSTWIWRLPFAVYVKLKLSTKHRVYGKRQRWICPMWPSFPFTHLLLFIIPTRKSVDSRQFYL